MEATSYWKNVKENGMTNYLSLKGSNNFGLYNETEDKRHPVVTGIIVKQRYIRASIHFTCTYVEREYIHGFKRRDEN
jgi:hypothetical protein